MGRKSNDYSKTIIYVLHHKEDLVKENIYIGNSTNLDNRKAVHKHNCNIPTSKGYNTKKYQYIRDNGGFDNWDILEVEKYPCTCLEEAEEREQYWVNFYKSSLNKNRPYTRNPYYMNWVLNHPDYHKNYHKCKYVSKKNKPIS